MFKFTPAINVALASLLAVPALTVGGDGARSLERSLSETISALEYLAGLSKPPSSGELARVTEAPLADAPARDALLVALREDVNRLQTINDRLESGAHVELPARGPLPAALPLTTGLDQATRDQLAVAVPPPASGIRSPVAREDRERAARAIALEGAEFSADPLRQGQACYRAGRYEECLALLAKEPGDPRATYWSARAHEALGNHAAALEGYRAVAAAPDAGWLARRATSDLEFLTWKRERALREPPPVAKETP
jgi:hypothetical protein